MPGFRSLGELGAVDDVTVLVDSIGSIARARSRMAGLFLQSEADVWVTIDDDEYVAREGLAKLVAVCRETRGMVNAPSWMRQEKPAVSFMPFGDVVLEDVADAGVARWPRLRTGFGVVALHRDAVEKLAANAVPFRDETGGPYPDVFRELIVDGLWLGEDYSFCERACNAGIPIHLLRDVFVEHDGVGCMLSVRDGQLQAFRLLPDDVAPAPVTDSPKE